jgi:Raf kinase inhibitor-like YbhB/YbcL family protein
MLEKVPASIGRALRNTRAGAAELTIHDSRFAAVASSLRIASSAFHNGERIPVVFTADGLGVSPPLVWGNIPDDTESVVLLIEDADSPTPLPLVHAIAWDLAPVDTELPAGALSDERHAALGRNSFLARTYLPPDPPRAHGPHHYAFQLFACDRTLQFDSAPGRTRLIDALTDHTIAKGLLVGTYER